MDGPRPKFKLWMPMVVIVFVALGLGLYQRSVRLQRISLRYSGEAGEAEKKILFTRRGEVSDAEIQRIFEHIHWSDSVAAKYGKAARQPWILIDPDPRKIPCKCGHQFE